MRYIGYSYRVIITDDGWGFVKVNPVFSQILSGFASIPFKEHSHGGYLIL